MSKTGSQPQLKDIKLYESLRQEGNSKEKAAKISNAAAVKGRKAVARKGGESPSYEDWTVKELRHRAKELELTGYSRLRKGELIKELRNH